MIPGQYRKLTAREMAKRRWRTTETLTNALASVPAGTEVRVIGKLKGVAVETLPCPNCKVTVTFRKVPPFRVEEVTD